MDISLQPAVLQWARDRAGLSKAELAEKLGLKEDKIAAWERSGEITLARAEKLANVTHTPFGYLFLAEPLVEQLPIRDFRTVQTQEILKPSVDLLDVVNDALQKQDWYRDYLVAMDVEPITFVGSLKVSKDIHETAESIRRTVAWSADLSTRASSWESALSQHIDAVEDAGILVMRSGIVGNNTHRPLSVSEFRGFALSDKYAPLIFINGKDAKAAQIFTLAHELVHIGLGLSGVSNLYRTYSPDTDVEYFCNAVAAELLVPAAELKALLADVEYSGDKIAYVARHFKVSSLVSLRRLRDTGFLPNDEFERRYTDELTQIRQRSSDQSGGGDFYVTLRARVGERFLSALVGNTLEGGTTYREAFQLLGVSKAEMIRKLAEEIGTTT